MVTAGANNHNNNGKIENKADEASGLFIWTAANLKQATQSLNAQWVIDENNTNPAINLADISGTRIISDTRKLKAGDIFLAIVGENFNGHEFLKTAEEKGAIAAIVSQPSSQVAMPQLQVEDTRLAFGQLAAYRRKQHPNLKVIAITGSSGKTTVKEMLRSIFIQAEIDANTMTKACVDHTPSIQDNQAEPNSKTSQDQLPSSSSSFQSASTLVTRGNLNNDFGVPMMLLELSDKHQYAVLELGANHVGEIAYTANIVQPDVACILNIGTAHLGEFGGRDNIAKTKAEIYQPLTQNHIAVVPVDDDYAEFLTDKAKKHTDNLIHFGWHNLADEVSNRLDTNETVQPHSNTISTAHTTPNTTPNTRSKLPEVYAIDVHTLALQSRFTLCFNLSNNQQQKRIHPDSQRDIKHDTKPDTTAPIELPIVLSMAGEHNVSNALAAAASAYAVGIHPETIARGLQHAKSSKGRLGRQSLGNHQIIDDTYNANPNSIRAAADVLASQEGIKILVLGDIGELGEAAVEEHTKVGQAVAGKTIDRLLCVGEFAENTVSGALSKGMHHAHAFANKADLLAELIALLEHETTQNHKCTLLFKGSRTASMETLIEDISLHFERDSLSCPP